MALQISNFNSSSRSYVSFIIAVIILCNKSLSILKNNEKIITDVSDLSEGDRILLQFANGDAKAQIIEV